MFPVVSAIQEEIPCPSFTFGLYPDFTLQADFLPPAFASTPNRIYVSVDSNPSTIWEFDTDGNFYTSWNTADAPTGIGSDLSGNIYVAARDDSIVKEYDMDGNFLMNFDDPDGFMRPRDVGVNDDGTVYVADRNGTNSRILEFNSFGDFVGELDVTGLGEIRSITTSHFGDVFVTIDTGASTRVYKFDEFLSPVTDWFITFVTGNSYINRDFSNPSLLYVTVEGVVPDTGFIAERFDTDGNIVDQFQPDNPDFAPKGIDTDEDDFFWVIQNAIAPVALTKFNQGGNPVESFGTFTDQVFDVEITAFAPPVMLSNTAPVITLLGDNPQTIIVNDAYTELGATAFDAEDGDITGSIVIDSSAVDTSMIGGYIVTYDVTDSGAPTASPLSDHKERTVNVVASPPPPVVTNPCEGAKTLVWSAVGVVPVTLFFALFSILGAKTES